MEKTREELLSSPFYWLQHLQLDLRKMVLNYLSDHDMTRSEFAQKLGVSKGYVSQLLAADFDSKLSKLVQLALACDCIPQIEFYPKDNAERIYHSKFYNNNPELLTEKVKYEIFSTSFVLKTHSTDDNDNMKYVVSNYSPVSSKEISLNSASDWSQKTNILDVA